MTRTIDIYRATPEHISAPPTWRVECVAQNVAAPAHPNFGGTLTIDDQPYLTEWLPSPPVRDVVLAAVINGEIVADTGAQWTTSRGSKNGLGAIREYLAQTVA